MIYILVTLPDGTCKEYWYTETQWAALSIIMGTPDNIIKP